MVLYIFKIVEINIEQYSPIFLNVLFSFLWLNIDPESQNKTLSIKYVVSEQFYDKYIKTTFYLSNKNSNSQGGSRYLEIF